MINLKRLLLALVVLVLAALVFFFVLENRQDVSLVFFGWGLPAIPAALLLVVAFLAGLLIGPVIGAFIVIRGRRALRG